MTLKSKRAAGFLSWIGLSDQSNPEKASPRAAREQPLTSARIARLRRMGVKARQLMDAYKDQER